MDSLLSFDVWAAAGTREICFKEAVTMKENPMHVCQAMRNGRADIDIEKIGEKWIWVFWRENKSSAHEIVYCPYCGMKLK